MPPSKEFLKIVESIRDGERYQKLLDDIVDLHNRKNAGYSGDSGDPFFNFKQSLLLGITPFKGCLVRMTDKFSRIISLTSNPDNEKVGESIMDTLMDLAVYALIAICLYLEERKEERENNERIIHTEETDIKSSHEYTPTTVFLVRGDNVERSSK